MKSCAIASADRKVNIKTAVKFTCLLFVFFVSTHNVCSARAPDLIIEADQTEIGNTTIEPGASFDITASVWNQGKSVSEATHLGYYITTGTVLSIENTVAVLGAEAVKSLSGAGAHPRNRRSVLSKTITMPADLSPGSYFLMVCVIPVAGEDASNNSQWIEITVTAPPPVEPPDAEPRRDIPSGKGPDLVIGEVRVDASTLKVFAGVRMHILIQNQGTVRAPATMLEFYRSLDATISTEDTLLRAMPIGQLDKGRVTATHTVLPGALEAGTYYYGVCITPVEGESDTTNNCSEALAIEFVVGDENLPLQGRGQILKRKFDVGDDAEVFDVGRYFTRKVETYTASSDDGTIATAVMSGSEVTVTPIAEGWTIIRITAQDAEELAEQTFIVAVGEVEGPLLAPIGTIPAQALDVEAPAVVLPVGRYFAGEVQEWTVSSGDAEVVTAEISGESVSLSPVGIGETTVTVEASRGDLRAKQSFSVVVRPDTSPEVSIPNAGLREAIRSTLGLEDGATLTERKMRQLTRLDARQRSVTDLTGLEHAVNLTFLNLYDNGIVDISVVGSLTQLTELDLSNNRDVDISTIGNLTKLRKLILNDSGISDISVVGSLTQLTYLDLSGTNEIVDISAVSNLTQLTYLVISGWVVATNKIVDISAVSNLTQLTYLAIYSHEIVDISAVGNLTQLTYLDLRWNLITDVSALENLTNLDNLYLDGNDITDFAPLRRLIANNPSLSIDIDIPPGAPSLRMLPKETALLSNYPNPSNPETWIPYHLAAPADVTLTIYDLRGVVIRRLVIGHQPAGVYQRQGRAAHWDGRNALGEPVASGVYFYTLIAGDFTATKKLLIRK